MFGIVYDLRFCTLTVCHLDINNCVYMVSQAGAFSIILAIFLSYFAQKKKA